MGQKSAFVLCLSVAFLVSLGLVMLTSTSVWDSRIDGYSLVIKQAVWIGLGTLCAFAISRIDYKIWAPYWGWMLVGVCFLLVLCYVPGIGQEIKGESRWVKFPGFQFQPSEMAKIVVILSLAAWYAHYQTEAKTFFKGFVLPCFLIVIPVGLIFFEKDMGTSMGLGLAGVIVMFVAGVRMPYLGVSAAVALAGMAAVVIKNPERMGRINALFDLESDKYRLSDGYQQLHGLYAFANGGINGAGLGNGVEKLGYLPEAHTDFIFPAIGEELGLWFTLGSVLCFVLIVICGIAISLNAKDIFGRLLAMGLTSVIVIPAMLNIGVCTAVLPNTGLPLPFISYGGTNLIFTLLAVGLLVSIHRQTRFLTRSEMPLVNKKKQSVRI